MLEVLSVTEENYLKSICMLSQVEQSTVSTNAIAAYMGTSAASVTDMLKRLTEKGLTIYEKYKGVSLSKSGKDLAIQLIRKHRLWETFMVEKLNFTWDEVHHIAEQLEHIQSEQLIDRLDAFLDFPRFDPHGDPIPDKEGKFEHRQQILLSKLEIGQKAIIVGVNEHSSIFLRHLAQVNLKIGTNITILEKFDFDQSLKLALDDGTVLSVSNKVCQNLFTNPL